jgi:Gram-negative porin
MRTFLMIALLTASTAGIAADPQMEEMQSVIKAQQEQIDFLLQRLDSTREVVLAVKEQVEANAQAAIEANEKAEILADNMESQPVLAEPSTRIGGYGELHANLLEDQVTGEDSNVLDLHRFVLFFGHDFNDRLRFMSELEIEHSLSGDGKPGEVELEQAYIEYDWATGQSMRAGVVLVPVGILNETHEPPTFYGVERNPVEKNIIPTTWWEGGLQFHGGFADAWRYDAAVHSGLYTDADDNYAIRAGRQKVAKAKFDSGAATGRIRWLGVPGLELSASVQYQDDITQETDPAAGSAWLFTGHVSWQHKAFGLRALYADWTLDGEGPEAIGADRQKGWYIEPSWRFNEKWGVFARYNRWDNKAGNNNDSEYSQWDLGINYWLHPNVVFKLDYQDQDAPDGKKELDGWNLGVGYQF